MAAGEAGLHRGSPVIGHRVWRSPSVTSCHERAAPAALTISRDDLKKRIATAVLAFRGYDLTNLGRGPELLEHRAYGPVVRATLDSASLLCGRRAGQKGRPGSPGPGARTVHSRDFRPRYRHDRRHGAGPDPAARRVFRDPCAAGAVELRPQHRRALGAGRLAACTRWSSSCRSRWPWRPIVRS